MGEGRAPEVIPQQLGDGRCGQYIGVSLYGATVKRERKKGLLFMTNRCPVFSIGLFIAFKTQD